MSGEWKRNETNHWHECTDCGEKSEVAAHTFQWVTDKEATETENGSKHEECSVCGYKKAAIEIPAIGTGVSKWLNTRDHIQYLHGYSGSLFGPDCDMTRAEAAQMFYNLLLNKEVPVTVRFDDVPDTAWYSKAVNTLASMGIVIGIGGDQYAPERPITRAEFTVIAMRFVDLPKNNENIFSDVSENAWYYDSVVGAIQYGWIDGYPDGTFAPESVITRAEVTTIVNRMLNRSADKNFVDHHGDELKRFSDVSKSHWAYDQIMEAANTHDFKRDQGKEIWIDLQK